MEQVHSVLLVLTLILLTLFIFMTTNALLSALKDIGRIQQSKLTINAHYATLIVIHAQALPTHNVPSAQTQQIPTLT